MALISFTTDEQIRQELEQIAAELGTTVEIMMQRAVREIIRQHQPKASPLELAHEREEPLEYPDWMKPLLFNGGTEVTGSRAEEILSGKHR